MHQQTQSIIPAFATIPTLTLTREYRTFANRASVSPRLERVLTSIERELLARAQSAARMFGTPVPQEFSC